MTDGIGDLSQSVREQIQTDYAEHDSARKAEQQTDYLFGVTGEYDTYRTAQACTHDAGNSRNDDNKRKCTHVKTLSEAMRSSARMKRLPCDRPFNLYHSTNRLQVQLFTRRLRLSSRLFCVAFLFRTCSCDRHTLSTFSHIRIHAHCAVKEQTAISIFIDIAVCSLVEVTRLELATSRSLTVRATRLRHTSTCISAKSGYVYAVLCVSITPAPDRSSCRGRRSSCRYPPRRRSRPRTSSRGGECRCPRW